MRADGVLPTITKGSKLFSFHKGHVLGPKTLLKVMGFPINHYKDVDDFGKTNLMHRCGNTMHVGVMGFLIACVAEIAQP